MILLGNGGGMCVRHVNETAPPRISAAGLHYMEHETRFELATLTLARRCWVDFIEEFGLNRSYRVVSINSGGRLRGG
jgi:hypothetical protein